MKEAYERQDLPMLMAMYAENAVHQELGPAGVIYSTLRKAEIEQYYHFNLTQNPKFNYSKVVFYNDTLIYHGTWHSGLLEAIGMYEVEGEGQLVLRDGLIVTARWQENSGPKKRRLEIFNNFTRWLKLAEPLAYADLFASDRLVQPRANGNRVKELFLEWVSTKVNLTQERQMIDMSALPEVKRLRLEQDIVAICKEFRGPYAEAPKYVTEVQNYLNANQIAYHPYHVLGIYFDDPNQPHPETHRSIQGVVIDKTVDIQPPYFIYKMKQGEEYLYTKVKGNPADVIPAGYMALFNHMGLKKIQAGSSGGHQIVTMEGDQVVFEIYLKIDG